MGTPTIGGDITGVVTEDSGISATGDLDNVGFLTGNADDMWSISLGATYGSASTNPTTGEWTFNLDDANPVVNALDLGETLKDTFTVLMVDSNGASDTQVVTITITGVFCFLSGTRIETKAGAKPIECLKPGDLVCTENGYRPIPWIGKRLLDQHDLSQNYKLRPVRINAGALGSGIPKVDLIVSRQHRILVDSSFAKSMFGTANVFIAAVKLTGLPGISVDETLNSVAYYHLLFDKHEVVFAEGTPTESLFTGPEVFKMVDTKARQEILTLFPHLATLDAGPAPAHPIPSGKLQKALVAHHHQTSEPIIRAATSLRSEMFA